MASSSKKPNPRALIIMAIPFLVAIGATAFVIFKFVIKGPDAKGSLVLSLGDDRTTFKAGHCWLNDDTIVVYKKKGEMYPNVDVTPLGNSRYTIELALDSRHKVSVTSGPDGKLAGGQKCKKFSVRIDHDKGWAELDCPISITLKGNDVAPEKKTGSLRGKITFKQCDYD